MGGLVAGVGVESERQQDTVGMDRKFPPHELVPAGCAEAGIIARNHVNFKSAPRGVPERLVRPARSTHARPDVPMQANLRIRNFAALDRLLRYLVIIID